MTKYKYFIAAFSAFFIWGFFSLALKPIQNYASLDILFYRLFGSVLLLSFVNLTFRRSIIAKNWHLFTSNPSQKKPKIIFQIVLGGLILILNWFVFIFVVNHIGIKTASFAYLICPILTTVLAFFILKEKLNSWQWTAVLISIISCAILSFHDISNLVYSLIVASTYAFYLISQRKNYGFDKLVSLNIQLLIATVVVLPFYPSFSGAIPTEALFYFYIIIIVIFFTITPLFLNLYALQGLSSATVGILIYINPILNFIIAVFYYHEQVTSVQMFSYFLILISIVVFNKKLLFNTKNSPSA